LTSLTQMLSHAVVQQYGSYVQTSSAHVLHVSVSGLPVLQTACEHVPPPPPPPLLPPLLDPPELLPPPPPGEQLSPQYLGTSLTQMLSHWTWQQ
jgi:hypothetical protein